MQYLLFLAAVATAQFAPPTGGSGPYGPAYWYEEPSLPNHTIYMPASFPANRKAPVVYWANGQCYGDGLMYGGLLAEVASHGLVVVASGWVNSQPDDRKYEVDVLKDLSIVDAGITFAQQQAGQPGNWSTVDGNALAMAGHSCGGWQTFAMRNDARIKALGSQGWFGSSNEAAEIDIPIGVFIGGDDERSRGDASNNFGSLPDATPAWWGIYPGLVHEATYSETNGGIFATALAKWLLFALIGEEQAGSYFEGNLAQGEGWDPIVKQNLELIN